MFRKICNYKQCLEQGERRREKEIKRESGEEKILIGKWEENNEIKEKEHVFPL